MGDLRKRKISCRLISWGAEACKDIPGKNYHVVKNIPLMTYIMLKKILHRYRSGKKISNHRGLGKNFLPKLNTPHPLPHKRQMVNHIGGGRRSGSVDTLVSVIHQKMAGARSSWGGFQD